MKEKIKMKEHVRTYKGRLVRVMDDNGVLWFLAKDVARILGYRDANSMILRYDSSRGKFRTFLGVLVRHKVSDMLQGASHFSEFSVAEITKEPDSRRIPETTWTKSPEENDPFQKIFDEEYRNCLLSLALNELRNNVGAKTYAIFEMVVLQHRSPQDVARFLGINRAVIAVYCSRCRKKLKRIAAEIRIENPDFKLDVPL